MITTHNVEPAKNGETFQPIDTPQEVVEQGQRIEQLTIIPYLNEQEKNAVLSRLNEHLSQVLNSPPDHGFGIVRDVWEELGAIWGTDGRSFGREQMAANKLYAAGLFDKLAETETGGGSQQEAQRQDDFEKIYRAYFATSDLITDFTGTFGDRLELYALSRRSEAGRKLSRNLSAGLIYDGTFGDVSSDLAKAWESQHLVEGKLDYITSLEELLARAEDEIYDTGSLQDTIRRRLEEIARSGEVPVFVTKAAERVLQKVAERATSDWEWVDLATLPEEERDKLLKMHESHEEQAKEEQRHLHEAFPMLDSQALLYRVATDACAEVNQGDLGHLVTLREKSANLHMPERENSLGLSRGDAELLKQAHDDSVLEVIALESGLDLRQIPLESQIRFLRFMAEADRDNYSRLCEVLLGAADNTRRQFAEAFLATEFGSELGEAIIDIAAKRDHEHETREILSHISSIRDHVSEWESEAWFAEDGEYQGYFVGIKRAIEMRISQILSPAADLMDGTPQDAQYFHRDGSVAETMQISSVEQVIQGLKLLDLWVKKVARSEAAPQTDRIPEVHEDFKAVTTLVDESKVRIMMRAHESNAAEARTRWTVSITPEEQIEIFGKYLDRNSQGQPRDVKVSLRLDLEKISGKLSLDLGSRMEFGGGDREYPDQLLAALVTAGVQHNLRRQGKSAVHTDYHVRDTFPDELSQPTYFAGFIESMQERYIDKNRVRRGRLGARATELAAVREMDGPNVVYTGLFLNPEATERLHDLFPARYPNVPQHPHVTVKFRPADGLDNFTSGKDHVVRVLGVVEDDRAQVLVVESDAAKEVKRPHITISTANDANGKPIPFSYSNSALRNGQVMMLEEPIQLAATSGYLDGSTGQVVTKSEVSGD